MQLVEDNIMIPIQFITHYTERYSYLDSARIALEGGCRWIQLRMKNCPLSEVEAVGRQVKSLCKEHDAIFIIDDYVELAQKLEADGVHLGKNDMPVAEARQVLGEGFLIGGTANTFEDIVRHYQGGADYIGCGPFRFTTTKQNLSPVLGLQGYASLMQQMKEADIHLPVVAIGGITRQDIPDILRTGVHGIALSGAILHADNPVKEMQDILNL
jgi:thiamine-phosphate pyrophosphorylase